jgi:hypothetical protein
MKSAAFHGGAALFWVGVRKHGSDLSGRVASLECHEHVEGPAPICLREVFSKAAGPIRAAGASSASADRTPRPMSSLMPLFSRAAPSAIPARPLDIDLSETTRLKPLMPDEVPPTSSTKCLFNRRFEVRASIEFKPPKLPVQRLR